ncbi:MAG: hypothetical protein P1U83_14515 [Roseovarius sp.]|nr:hypothetical protein [Roseovarius sp.]
MTTNWYWPRLPERKVYDYACYVGGADDHTGDEALRRSSYAHGTWIMNRTPETPWIAPLMDLGCVRKGKTSPRPTDLFLITAGLLLSERAREVLAPLAGPMVGFLPVEVVNGPQLWWAMGPVVPQALDLETSRVTIMFDKLTSITQPVLFRDKMPEAGFVSLNPRHASPVLSAKIADAIKEADLYGLDLRPVEEV